jgi:hypothetical protein
MKLKPYLSYWSKGYYKDKNQDFIKKMYAISSSLLKGLYGEVHLVTDEWGKNFLKDVSFTSIDYSLESLPWKGASSNWSLGKVKTYNLAAKKGDVFMHIDADVFLSKRIPDSYLEDADALFEHEQRINSQDLPEINFFIQNLPNRYNLYIQDFYTKPNFSFFYFKDLQILTEITDEILKLSLDLLNLDFIHNKSWSYSLAPAIVTEEIYFYQLMKSKNKIPKYLISDIEDRKEAEDLKYIHLWGKKDDPFIQKKINEIYNNIV